MIKARKILTVNLLTRGVEQAEFPREAGSRLLYGRGFNALYLSGTKVEEIDPLDTASELVMSCGMLAGMGAPAASRLHITARSPLTGFLGSSNVGGEAAERLAAQGIGSLVIQGGAEVPSVLWIRRGQARVIEAPGLWGEDTWNSTRALQEQAGTKHVSVLAIGPGGENLVRFACIMAGGHHAAGRTGLGAVMGAKLLKAVVIEGRIGGRGAGGPGAKAAAEYAREITRSSEFEFFSAHGGAGYLTWAHNAGIMSAFNFRSTRFGAIPRIDGRLLTPAVKKRKGCPGCPVKCKADLKLPGLTEDSVRPEFEPMMALGPRCGLCDLEKIVYLDNLCSRLGLDNISTAGVLAFAMDLHDRGLLAEFPGITPVWGDADSMEKIIELIVRREGIGDILAGGIMRAAAALGNGADLYAAHVKGLELSGYHPGALAYCVAGRGGDFNDLYPALEYSLPSEGVGGAAGRPVDDTAAIVRRAMLVSYSLDCLGLCKVPVLSLGRSWNLEREASLVSALSGEAIGAKDLKASGERTAALERILNLRCGLDISCDRLPQMFSMQDYRAGAGGSFTDPPTLEFYRRMGWDEHGRPGENQLKKLGLDYKTAPSVDQPAGAPIHPAQVGAGSKRRG
jgi:aldehyde:ferredoxin oxidoreductase